MYGALQLAYQRLSKSDAKHKHVIALTDGHTGGADHEGIVRAMVANGITMSTVAVGADSAVGLLQRLAKIGKGNFYFSDTPRSIPRIFKIDGLTSEVTLYEVDALAIPDIYGSEEFHWLGESWGWALAAETNEIRI